ncbi:hypothetical protein AMTR_s00164p00057540 [Amborella trichopoda]|uniref:Uncharacterized protein n=1 Tax=Amborella trichopoda TaxID=13333 RepID=W1PUE2_AMBTC|nr:hypothetical protein AMTR_s00164p00057540 [Amborella trichopoda]
MSPTKARTPAASLDPTSALVFPTSPNHPISCLNTASKAVALTHLISFPPATATKPLFIGGFSQLMHSYAVGWFSH